jgi:hypothetical protein
MAIERLLVVITTTRAIFSINPLIGKINKTEKPYMNDILFHMLPFSTISI